ncbi:hypothetical protein [Anabaena catenula]|uniref:Uncharacterized protein n=1 Tax=Anabaena catenula FACHB-362 TaxID=2692877 RepID=A0ABR8J042_9NOST|nr:hypothetical protein [Anabaena catenula]MBD2690401.1 hypothetical protein [Anabaena catenula FACHB-362]
MRNNFNFKSLAISGIAIASVLVLFKTVTAYGENNLRATSLINSRYRLTLAKNLPNCEKGNSLILNIQQSGIYLNASLLPPQANADTKKQFPLSGKLQNQELHLSGKIDTSNFCQLPSAQNSPDQAITIQMSKLKNDHIPGQLKINNIPTTLEFTASAQTDQKEIPKTNSH